MRRTVVALVVAGGVALGAIGLLGLLGRDPEPAATPGEALSVGEALDRAGELAGTEVTVVGEDQPAHPAPGDARRARPDRRSARDGTPSFDVGGFAEGDEILVRGTLEQLDSGGLLRRIPGATTLPRQFQDFERRPVLLAGAASPAQDAEAADVLGAREGAQVTVGDVRYRVATFRRMNPRIQPGSAFYTGAAPGRGRGLYALFLRACNDGDPPVRASRDVVVRDAFGEAFAPRPDDVAAPFRYAPSRAIAPGACAPAQGSAARSRFDGGALVFEIPLQDVRETPLVLEIRDGGERGRLELRL